MFSGVLVTTLLNLFGRKNPRRTLVVLCAARSCVQGSCNSGVVCRLVERVVVVINLSKRKEKNTKMKVSRRKKVEWRRLGSSHRLTQTLASAILSLPCLSGLRALKVCRGRQPLDKVATVVEAVPVSRGKRDYRFWVATGPDACVRR